MNLMSQWKQNVMGALSSKSYSTKFQVLEHSALPCHVKIKFKNKVNGPRNLQVFTALFTSDGQERFYNKELHKCQFKYYGGGKMRPARPHRLDTLKVIMFQGFDWESYNHNPSWWIHFQSKIEDLFQLGITDIWLPPASQSVDKQGYLPGQLYNLDASAYGKGIDLRNLLDVLHKYGISGIADIVINHRTAGKQDTKGHWNIFEGGVSDKRLAWGAWAVSNTNFPVHGISRNSMLLSKFFKSINF